MENLADAILLSVETGLVDKNIESLDKYRPKMVINNYKKGNKVLSEIVNELKDCDSFMISVAFITDSGVTVLLETLKELNNKGIRGSILTTDYLNFSSPNALKKLLEFPNLSIRVYTQGNFHTKGYIFKKGQQYTLIVGSSNLTQTALASNKEWNIKITSTENGELISNTINDFNYMWQYSEILTESWIDNYEKIYKEQKAGSTSKVKRIKQYSLQPNKMQMDALIALEKTRNEGSEKALLISATGTGKTYLSAFDIRNYRACKVLFLVHREQILVQAMKSFKDVLGDDIKAGFLTGNRKDYDSDFLFSTVWMMAKENIYSQFKMDYFDYIILDEAHKAGAASYQYILDYFKPKFLLGMTATPERMDGFDIYELFDHNIAYEIRLQQAMEEDLLCPFHYFGVSELTIDGKIIDDTTSFSNLISDVRVDNIIEKIKFYGYSGERVKGLIFCSRIEEAKELSNLFNKRGYNTIVLSGNDSQEVREDAIKKLEQDNRIGGFDYIFTIDIFNEGVDIPCINQVVMLRPTKSSIIFIQQLGRGLRKNANKEYVIVIDFIGNYKTNFFIPLALSGDKTYNKDNIRKFIAEGNRVIPGCSTINFDEISKQRIYASIDAANFSDVKLIKEQYFNLKYMLGRIPALIDFEKFGSIDVMRIIENKSLGSYHNFLKKYDKEYKVILNPIQEEMIEFISQKVAHGKRKKELILLKRFIGYQHGYSELLSINSKEVKKEQSENGNVISVLSNKFVTNEVGKNRFSNSVFIETDGEKLTPSKQFLREIEDKNFYMIVNELLDFGIRRNQNMYSNTYKNTDFVLYGKYTYEDVCKLLNWDTNVVAQNIGGYKYDKKTNSFPVFINYNKEESISDTIKYEDRFISPLRLIALSKQPRKRDSKDVQQIYQAKENGTKIYLFVRKNKDDNTSKEFYFLGEIFAIGEPYQITIKNTNKSAVEINYQLDIPVREDLYEYIIE